MTSYISISIISYIFSFTSLFKVSNVFKFIDVAPPGKVLCLIANWQTKPLKRELCKYRLVWPLRSTTMGRKAKVTKYILFLITRPSAPTKSKGGRANVIQKTYSLNQGGGRGHKFNAQNEPTKSLGIFRLDIFR